MKVYIVRHGQAVNNVLRQYNTSDEDLTELGINQAKLLRERIRNIHFDIVISSPLLRATHTEYILTNYDDDIITDDRLRERSCGTLSGEALEVTNREEYWNYYSEIQYGISENIKDFFKRVFNFLDELKTKDYKSVLIVAHSGVSKAFSAYFEGIQNGKFLNRGLKNCEMKQYQLENERR